MSPSLQRWMGLVSILVGLFGSPSFGDEIPPQIVDGKISWVYGYQAGKAESLRSGKPMFVVFRCER